MKRSPYASRLQGPVKFLLLLLLAQFLIMSYACEGNPAQPKEDAVTVAGRSARLGLWLAKKSELLEHESAAFDLVMTARFEPDEAAEIKARYPSAKLLSGLTLTWVSSDPAWQTLLTAVANGGDPGGPYQITDDMFLM